MSIKNKIHHTVYFLLFGIIIGILRWTICIVDTNGGMNFTPFLQAFLLIIALLLFVIWDIVLHKIALRVISTIILLCFNIWSYTYYFRFSTVWHNHLRNKHLTEHLRNNSNELATVRFSAFCGAMLSNNSFLMQR